MDLAHLLGMAPISLLGIAVGLSMDAFAVAAATSLALPRVAGRQVFRLSFHFGLFQFLMPVLGWALGTTVRAQIAAFDHWLAFGLLALVGGKMIRDAWRGEEADGDGRDPTKGLSLLVLSLATSVDALAVGLSLAFLDVPIWRPSLVIGVTCALLTAIGMAVGRRAGRWVGKRAELVGGLVLLAIGAKILVEHLGGRG